jgi:hypothetical protein
MDEQFAALARFNSGLEENPDIKVQKLRSELAEQDTMDQFYEVLNSHSATFIDDVNSYPETTQLCLSKSGLSMKSLSITFAMKGVSELLVFVLEIFHLKETSGTEISTRSLNTATPSKSNSQELKSLLRDTL